VHKTYAPEGWRIYLRAPLTRAHLSVIGAMTPEGDLSVHIQEKPINGWNIILFLTHLLKRFDRLLVVWDGSPIHRSELLHLFIHQVGPRRLQTFFFPPYAPEMNPVESLWRQLKNEELANLSCQNIGSLAQELRLAVNKIRVRPSLIRSYFDEPGLDITEFIQKKV
jgi:transposase